MSYAAALVPALRALAAELTAAGVPAALSRGSLKVPGAWVRPDTTDGPVNLAGGGQARVSVLLVAPEGGDEEALTDLTDLLDLALTVLDPVEPVDTSVVLPLNNNRLPAFRLAVDLDL
jgi:hypothetical protein